MREWEGILPYPQPRFALCAFGPEATTSVHMWLDQTVVHIEECDPTVAS